MRTWRVVALALFGGAFLTLQPMLMNEVTGHPMTLRGVVSEMAFWVIWAAFTPIVLAAARRWPLGIQFQSRSIAAHVIVSLLLAPVTTIVYEVVVYRTLHLNPAAMVWGIFSGMLYYWALLVLLTTFRFRGLYATSRLDALRSQLQPHFLFNTLNAISVLSRQDPDKTQRMIQRLSSLLRRSLDEQAHEVPLRQELAFLEDYLDIQRVRFGEKLQVRINVDPSVLDTRVPVFLLQPLVENSLKYGVADDGSTEVMVDAGRVDGSVRILVEDGGERGTGNGEREGVGLGNTRARLEQLYGARASIVLSPRDGRGMRVEVRIPL